MKVFTVEQVAKICKVAPRTVSKWLDSGRLKGYRIPGTPLRRIPREYLIMFLKEHGMPLGDLESLHPDEDVTEKTEPAKTCQTCEHFAPNPDQCMGNCDNPELPNRVDFDTFAVSPDFGCILHTPKADDPQT